MRKKFITLSLLVTGFAFAVSAADPTEYPPIGSTIGGATWKLPTLKGHVAVIDGRTLWYSQVSTKVRLASIDACELPQWSFDSRRTDVASADQTLRPVPCGPLARAWLKRTISDSIVQCSGVSYDEDGTLNARCDVKGHDVGFQMLRVGWARVRGLAPASYGQAQHIAMTSRYGMWGTYVLDMPEWRDKAVDRTLARRPLADFNLILERNSEISPPFADARRLPKRTDR